MEHKRQVSYEQGKELARQYNIQFLETSAKEVVNIEELFITTARNFLDKQSGNIIKDKKEKNLKSNTISIEDLNNGQSQNKNSCC